MSLQRRPKSNLEITRYCRLNLKDWLTHFYQVDDEIDDKYFSKPRSSGKVSAEEEFFSEGKPKEKESHPENKVNHQKKIDKIVIEAIKKQDDLSKYLKASFGLSKGQFPHQLVF
jgi:large subunit ribosomal protein L6e